MEQNFPDAILLPLPHPPTATAPPLQSPNQRRSISPPTAVVPPLQSPNQRCSPHFPPSLGRRWSRAGQRRGQTRHGYAPSSRWIWAAAEAGFFSTICFRERRPPLPPACASSQDDMELLKGDRRVDSSSTPAPSALPLCLPIDSSWRCRSSSGCLRLRSWGS